MAAAAPSPPGPTSSASTSTRRRRRASPWPSAWPSTARTVTSPRRTSAWADEVGPADHADGGLLRQGHRQLVGRRVVLDGLDAAPRLGQGIGRGQRPRAQPPERARGRVALDDAAAGGDQPGRIEPQPGQRAGRLPHDEGRIGARCPGDVPQPLDRVHLADPTPARATVPRRGERSVPGADLDPDPGRGPNPGAVADHLPPGLRRHRPVHQRERLDPRHRGPDHAQLHRRRGPGELGRGRDRRGRPSVPRPAGRRSS